MRKEIAIIDSEFHLRNLEYFRNADPEVQRYLVYRHKIGGVRRIMKFEDNAKIAYFLELMIPMCVGKKGFIRTSCIRGISYNKKEKKLNIWFGENEKKMRELGFLRIVMKDMGKSWFYDLNSNLRFVLTKRYLLEKIFRGTTTTAEQCVEVYLKTSLKIKDVPGDLYISVIKLRTIDIFSSLSIYDINGMLRHATSPVETLKWLLSNQPDPNTVSRIQIIVQYLYITGDKISWADSPDNLKTEKEQQEKKVEAMDMLCCESGMLKQASCQGALVSSETLK